MFPLTIFTFLYILMTDILKSPWSCSYCLSFQRSENDSELNLESSELYTNIAQTFDETIILPLCMNMQKIKFDGHFLSGQTSHISD